MTSFGAAESNRKAEAGIKIGKNHPGPTKRYWKALLLSATAKGCGPFSGAARETPLGLQCQDFLP